MNDPLWRCLDANFANSLTRDQLELVVQKKKVNELFVWFEEHFKKSSRAEYIQKCPMVIIQGPTGCGKTTTLKWIAKELNIPIKEYSETTDLTAINYDLMQALASHGTINHRELTIEKRKALKFQHFVINSIRYDALYAPDGNHADADAASEFDSDDEFIYRSSKPPEKAPPVSGVIIHIETPLSFARAQNILCPCLGNLRRLIRDMSKTLRRRVAIVFESLEGDGEIICLPSKVKVKLGVQVFKLNPIIRVNMKKFIESITKNYKHILIDKETIEQLINDCDGDVRACINTLQLLCNRSNQFNHNFLSSNGGGGGIPNQENGNRINYINSSALTKYYNDNHYLDYSQNSPLSPINLQATKRQKLNHDKTKQVRLYPSLLRDNTRGLNFFHTLGKIFYQKRIYPDPLRLNMQAKSFGFIRSIDRPYPTENSTEDLVNLLDTEPRNLMAWLHQHYHKFCSDGNIDKAALFLENHSLADTTTLNSTQSSQFYEMLSTLDQVQIHLAIELTMYSLYQDQSHVTKTSHKKTQAEDGFKIIKSSVECSSPLDAKGDLYSFKKPSVMTIGKLVEDYQSLLNICSKQIFNVIEKHLELDKLLLDYIPYLKHLANDWSNLSPSQKSKFYPDFKDTLLDDENLVKLYKTIDEIDFKDQDTDYSTRHDQLLEMIEEIDFKDHINSSMSTLDL